MYHCFHSMSLIFYMSLNLLFQRALSINANFPRTVEDVHSLFIKHGIVPDVIRKPPDLILRVEYKFNDVDFGNLLDYSDMMDAPELAYWPVDRGEYYTLVMTGPDVPTRENPHQREWNHWIVVNIPEISVKHGETLADYTGQVSFKKNVLRRYVFLLYKHPQGKRIPFTDQHLDDRPIPELRANFSVQKFAEKYQLGEPFAGNFCFGLWNVSDKEENTQRTLHPWDVWE